MVLYLEIQTSKFLSRFIYETNIVTYPGQKYKTILSHGLNLILLTESISKSSTRLVDIKGLLSIVGGQVNPL